MFFFRQKTAYEIRISDWSSYVCSSDLVDGEGLSAHSDKQHANSRQRKGKDESEACLLPLPKGYADPPPHGLDLGLDRIQPNAAPGSEERRVRKEGDSKCRTRWSPHN